MSNKQLCKSRTIIEERGTHLGLKWSVMKNQASTFVGYVCIPESHHWFGKKDLMALSDRWPVISFYEKFGDSWWIGFRCDSAIGNNVLECFSIDFPLRFDMEGAVQYCKAICRGAHFQNLRGIASSTIQPLSLYDTSAHSESLRAEAALCAWEYALDCDYTQCGIPDADQFNSVDRGAVASRHIFMDMAPSILAVYDEIDKKRTYDLAYDWEIVPEIVISLDFIVPCLDNYFGNEPLTIGKNHAIAAARAVESRLAGIHPIPELGHGSTQACVN